jgi:hypothetical protein
MPIVWVKRIYIKIPRIGEHIYRTVLGSVKCWWVINRSELFKMDENLAFCDIQAEKLTLG